jgi:hypothetical protein
VVRQVETEIGMNCLSWAGGEEILKYKTAVLSYQKSVILNNKIYSKWMAEQECKNKRSAELYKLYNKIIGFLAGIGQVATGVGICVSTASSGMIPGASMIMQGLNNTYENGYYLVVYEEVSGHSGTHTIMRRTRPVMMKRRRILPTARSILLFPDMDCSERSPHHERNHGTFLALQ